MCGGLFGHDQNIKLYMQYQAHTKSLALMWLNGQMLSLGSLPPQNHHIAFNTSEWDTQSVSPNSWFVDCNCKNRPDLYKVDAYRQFACKPSRTLQYMTKPGTHLQYIMIAIQQKLCGSHSIPVFPVFVPRPWHARCLKALHLYFATVQETT